MAENPDASLDERALDTRSHVIDWTKRVLEKLTVKNEEARKGVEEIMAGYILHTRTDDILDTGRAQGRAQRDREKIEVMLRKNKSPQEIADFCDYPMNLILDVQGSLMVK